MRQPRFGCIGNRLEVRAELRGCTSFGFKVPEQTVDESIARVKQILSE